MLFGHITSLLDDSLQRNRSVAFIASLDLSRGGRVGLGGVIAGVLGLIVARGV